MMIGILAAEQLPHWGFLGPLVGSCVMLLAAVASMWIRRDKGALFFLLSFLACFLLGFSFRQLHRPELSHRHYTHYIAADNDKYPPQTLSVLKLREPPYEKGRSARVVAEVLRVGYPADSGYTWFDTRGKVQLFFPKGEPEVLALRRGDTLLAMVPYRVPASASDTNNFDYRRYLSYRDIYRTAYLRPDDFVEFPTCRVTFMQRVDNLRFSLLSMLKNTGLTSSEQAIASALLLGWSNDIEEDTRQQFRDAGITHLLCVSGLHVGIISMLIGWMIRFLRGYQMMWIRCLIQTIGVWLFVLLTGMSPATLRAGIMFSIIAVGQCVLLYRTNTLASVALSAFILLMARPTLLFDVSFQLSYAAVVGILCFYRPLMCLFPWRKIEGKTIWCYLLGKVRSVARAGWGILCVSTAAQLGTLPFVLYHFHQFPTYFLVTNLLVLPLATLLMVSILLVLIFSWWPWALQGCCWLLHWELRWVDAVTRQVSSLPHSTLVLPHFDWIDALLVALLVILLAIAAQLWINQRRAARSGENHR